MGAEEIKKYRLEKSYQKFYYWFNFLHSIILF